MSSPSVNSVRFLSQNRGHGDPSERAAGTAEPGSRLPSGRIVDIGDDGIIYVAFGDDAGAPVRARTLVDITPGDKGREVLLAFASGSNHHPIILGIVQERCKKDAPTVALPKEAVEALIMDGDRICFEARREIVLKCGQGSVTLRKDGKIVIKGTEILSRSKGTNRIKGAAVSIN